MVSPCIRVSVNESLRNVIFIQHGDASIESDHRAAEFGATVQVDIGKIVNGTIISNAISN
ncbi:MAG: hypothetical protein OXM61_06840 [Candidatus Poribacteria bacterium]|nr:hypothetical protein [Candidatus Poribacteria bacterium]